MTPDMTPNADAFCTVGLEHMTVGMTVTFDPDHDHWYSGMTGEVEKIETDGAGVVATVRFPDGRTATATGHFMAFPEGSTQDSDLWPEWAEGLGVLWVCEELVPEGAPA